MTLIIPLNNEQTNKFREFLDIAKKESLKSEMKHKHGACIVYKNKIIASGYNYNVEGGTYGYSIHAELSAIQDLFKKYSKYSRNILKDCIMYVIRIDKFNKLTLSKPCKCCTNMIYKYKLKKVYWTI
jgi:tRNA(Arg) A34 adenosine deaminase TadA